MKISYFGDTRSHTHAAALALLRDGGVCACAEKGYDTVFETLRAVASGAADWGVVPMENSLEGTVSVSVDALSEHKLYIVREIVLPVRQSLIVREGVQLKDVCTVYSHPQALAQCRHSLLKLLPHAAAQQVPYTSAALGMLDGHSAAIAREAGEGQAVLIQDLADSPDNCTRFVAAAAKPNDAGNKVSLLFATRNEAGALVRALAEIASRGWNMTKIESRPSGKRMGQYVFYVDFLFDGSDASLRSFTEALGKHTEEWQFLGKYDPYGYGEKGK